MGLIVELPTGKSLNLDHVNLIENKCKTEYNNLIKKLNMVRYSKPHEIVNEIEKEKALLSKCIFPKGLNN